MQKTVVIMEEEALKQLTKKVEILSQDLKILISKFNNFSDDSWLDGEEVKKILGISTRTLQNYRTNGVIGYSKFGKKVYYKAIEINSLLEDNYQNPTAGNH